MYRSNPRIILELLVVEPVISIIIPLVPALARPIYSRSRSVRNIDVGLPLQYLQRQSRRCVPGYVAVQEPGARVVGFEGEDEVSVCGQQGHVAARGVVEVQFYHRIPVWCVGLRQYREVVAVEMDLSIVSFPEAGRQTEGGERYIPDGLPVQISGLACRTESPWL